MDGSLHENGRRAAENAARTSYGRLIAYLARQWRDVAAAEDALAGAFARALDIWPTQGVPANPDAWLMVAARNRLRDGARARKSREQTTNSLLVLTPTETEEMPVIADKRLELMFVCAHPVIDAAARTPLMLQSVLGLTAERIASSFLVSPDTMGRRLSRAKARIKHTGVAFEVPEIDELGERMGDVLDAIYAAYGQGWDSTGSDDQTRKGLTEEAIWLARVLVELRPDDAEALGLLALMLFCESRSAARRVEGRYVPLAKQDMALWNLPMAREAEDKLRTAGGLKQLGRFQLEAAIQSVLVQSRLTGADLRLPAWTLHGLLAQKAPTIGNLVGLAAATAEVNGPEAGLHELALLPEAMTGDYQPFFALKAQLLQQLGADRHATATAFRRAIGLTEDGAVRAYLIGKSTQQIG
ncbi:RNA polymerase sigma factor [Pararhizobium sp. DWP3-4]|uniref:RNA polymerase sigma factor n=1 Tax=Pararhizobium sp. DWP3-4 TaxID=2804565 RepID=UPI003CEF9519